MDPACYYGVQFPDIDGPLAGFFERTADAAGVAGYAASEVESRLGARVVAVGGSTNVDRERPLEPDDVLVLFGPVRPIANPTSARRTAWSKDRFARSLRQIDPVSRGAIVAALLVFICGALFFARELHLDALTSAYFTITTMTTTGYGDISPRRAGPAALVGASLLMLAGIVFSGIFIAVLSSIFTQARYDAVQGLRRITRGGHVIVCGAGNVGSRVLDMLVALGCRVVVLEREPRPEIVEGSRERRYELLTGDAGRDATLDLCNIEGAAALVALTNSDTMNLEVALGARARNPALPIVMRVQHEPFQRSVRLHFEFERTFGTAALAAPVIADLALSPGARGRVTIGANEYAIVEMREDEGLQAPPGPDCLPLGLWRDGRLELLERFEDARPDERVLLLRPPAQVAAPLATEGAST
jgi:voltage-gated potassium channel Kch